MKKTKLLVLIFALIGMLIFLTPNICKAAGTAKVKVIKGDTADTTDYDDIQSALNAQTSASDIELQLQGDITNGKGFIVKDNKNVTIDFNGYTYNVASDLVGSEETETNACQLLKDTTVVFENGTLESDSANILVQNYSNLTVRNMELIHTKTGSGDYPIALSVNNGTVKVEGKTSITSQNIALDVYYWKGRYETGPDVTVNTSQIITGDILVRSSEDGEDNPQNKLTIENIYHESGNFTVSDKSKNNVTINGGTFNTSVEEYVKDSTRVCVNRDNRYVVGLKAQSLEVPENLELVVGDNVSLDVTVTPTDSVEPITYECDAQEVLSVTSDGQVTALAEGNATITVKVGTLTKMCYVTVKAQALENPEDKLSDPITPVVNETDDTVLSVGVSDTNKAEVDKILKETMMNSESPLYEEIMRRIESGESVTSEIGLTMIEETDIEQTVLDAILTAANADEIVQLLNIEIAVKANGQTIGNLTNLNGKIPVTVNIPTDLQKENRNFYVLRYHEGTVEKLELSKNGNCMEFYTDEFSVFALAYEDVNPDEINGMDGETPKTGDTAANIFALLVIVTAVILIVIRIKKKNSIIR